MTIQIHEDGGGDPPGFELGELRKIFGSDEQGLAEVLQLYAKDLGQWLSDWNVAQSHQELGVMEKLSHTLLGSSGMCGALQTSTLARKVNDALQDSGPAPDELVASLIASVEDNQRQIALWGNRPIQS